MMAAWVICKRGSGSFFRAVWSPEAINYFISSVYMQPSLFCSVCLL